MLKQVPYDDLADKAKWRYPFLFFGEEHQMAARFYTRGFDFFAPACTVFYHLWDRGHRPNFREVANASRQCLEKAAVARFTLRRAAGA